MTTTHAPPMRALLSGLIDYAGLYPPATLSPAVTVENFARDRAGVHAFIQGRLVWPTTKLEELTRRAGVLMPGTAGTSGYREHADTSEPWRVSAVVDEPLDRALDTVRAFNDWHADEDHGRAVIDAVEIRYDPAAGQDALDHAIDAIPDDVFPFFEIDWRSDARGPIAALAGTGSGAKLRTGGVTPDAFPDAATIADFLLAASHAAVPFKATAGLHHPLPGTHPLTYQPDCPTGAMHGFINVFLAAAFLHALRVDRGTLVGLLQETRPAAFAFDPSGIAWNNFRIEIGQIASARERFAMSFGSCSFDEPVRDLIGIGWLDR